MKWFTSDLHFNHKNICRGVSDWGDTENTRDFNSVEEMNNVIISSINDKVMSSDILYILGDFAFGNKSLIPSLRESINCLDVRLVYGNHDRVIMQKYQDQFTWCRHYHETKVHDKNGNRRGVVLFHYYIGGVWNKAGKGYCHLFGHSHGSLPKDEIKGKAFDIGWDVWNKPLNEHEICDVFDGLDDFKAIDHHSERTSYY